MRRCSEGARVDISAFEAFCFADTGFYRPLDQIDDSQSRINPRCDHLVHGVCAICGLELDRVPQQGWEIHITTTPHNHAAVVPIVAEVCARR